MKQISIGGPKCLILQKNRSTASLYN